MHKYLNRGLDFINISTILRNLEIQKLVPPYIDNIETLIFYQTLTQRYTIGMIVHYTSVTAEKDIETNFTYKC
jgi:hypothetical protein